MVPGCLNYTVRVLFAPGPDILGEILGEILGQGHHKTTRNIERYDQKNIKRYDQKNVERHNQKN